MIELAVFCAYYKAKQHSGEKREYNLVVTHVSGPIASKISKFRATKYKTLDELAESVAGYYKLDETIMKNGYIFPLDGKYSNTAKYDVNEEEECEIRPLEKKVFDDLKRKRDKLVA